MMDQQMDNERRFVIALEHWLESNLAGGQEDAALAMELVRAVLAGTPAEGTPFEWLATILLELRSRFHAFASEEEMDGLIEAEGPRVAAAVEEIFAGGMGLALARGFLADVASQGGAPEPAPAAAPGLLEESLDDLDSLFQSAAEDDFQSIMADMLLEQRPGVAGESGAREDRIGHDEMSPESGGASEVFQALDPTVDAGAPACEPIEGDVSAAAAQTAIDDVLKLVNLAPFPAGTSRTATEFAGGGGEKGPRQAPPVTPETEAEEGAAEDQIKDERELPDATATPDTPSVTSTITNTGPEHEQGREHEGQRPQEPAPLPDARQIALELAGQIRTLIVSLEHDPENQRDAAARLAGQIGEIDRRIRRMGHRLFSSLCDAVLAILETMREAHQLLPFDVIEKLGEFSQCIDGILYGRVSRNKSYYSLIKELNDMHDLLKARIEEDRELKRLERLARLDAGEAREAGGEACGGAGAQSSVGGPAAGEGGGKLTNIQEVFLEEAGENIDALTRNLLLIEKTPADQEIIYTLMRAAHSIKGSAAIARFPAISALAHAMEDLLVVFRDEALSMTGEAINLLLAGVDRLQALCLAAERGGEGEPEPLEHLIEMLKAAAARTLENSEQLRAGAVPAAAPPVAEVVRSAPAPAEKAEVRTVRVEISQLDSLMNLAADLVINRTRLLAQTERQEALLQSFADSRRQLKLLGARLTALLAAARAGELPALAAAGAESLAAASPRPARLPVGSSFSRSGQQLLRDFSAGEFDRFNELDLLARDLRDAAATLDDLGETMGLIAVGVEQNLSQVSHVANDLHQSIMKTRMVPIGQIFGRFPRVVRDLAAELGKQINLHLAGEETLLDKNIIEEIASPLVHIIRNAVDHGLETVEEREQLEKAPEGNIWLSARLAGNQVLIEVRDDGRGIDTARLRAAAVSRNFLAEEEAAAASEAELLGLLLLPGFSTAETVTDLSGRGVGLDVVNQAIKQLRGSLQIASEFGEGTTFSIRLPITLAINQALLFKAGGETFAIPLSSVDELIAAAEARILQSAGQAVLMLRGQVIPLFRLGALLGLKDEGGSDRERQIMIISDGVNRGALVVDALAGREEIVIKSLGNHLRKVRYFSGCTILGDGVVTLIVDPAQILHTGSMVAASAPGRAGCAELQEAGSAESAAEPQTRRAAERRNGAATGSGQEPGAQRGGPRKRRILVTDDSVSIRRFVGGILASAGFEVEMACDGMEALEKLEEGGFDLLLTDLEMPRMHGYELITEVRASGRHPGLPIVILTSRMGDKHSRKGLELGASAFMVKPFEQNQLLATVNSLLAAQGV